VNQCLFVALKQSTNYVLFSESITNNISPPTEDEDATLLCNVWHYSVSSTVSHPTEPESTFYANPEFL